MYYGAIWMTSQYLMHCVLRKTLCTSSSVSEIGEPQCGDPENCEINSFKTDNIDWYIINIYIIITVTWSELPEHVKLTGTDHQIASSLNYIDPSLSTWRLSCIVYREKHCVLRHKFQRGVNHSVVIRSIGSHSVKSTISRLITLVGI